MTMWNIGGLDFNELSLCVGIAEVNARDSKVRIVHMIRLKEPLCVLNRQWQSGEQFSVGKWYAKQCEQQKQYRQVEDIVPTALIEQMQGNGQGATIIECTLPVLFAPDFSLSCLNIDRFEQLPSLKNKSISNTPICPLFGEESTLCINPVRWPIPSYVFDELHGLRILLSYKLNALPEWQPKPQGGPLDPWHSIGEAYPIMSHLYMEHRTIGIVVEEFAQTHVKKKAVQFCILLNKQAELAIASYVGEKAANIGEYREYWPIKLDCYEFPLMLALGSSQSNRKVNGPARQEIIILNKLQKDVFEFNFLYESEDHHFSEMVGNTCTIPWLGKLMDPFDHLADAIALRKENEKKMLKFRTFPFWHLGKGRVAWILTDFAKEVTEASVKVPPVNAAKMASSTNALTSQYHQSTNDVHQGDEDEMYNDAASTWDPTEVISSKASTHSLLQNDLSLRNAEKKIGIASLMTIRQSDGEAVFLFWDLNNSKFSLKCYAQFHKSLTPLKNIGEWYQLKFIANPYSASHIIIFDYVSAENYAVTRLRNGISAQYSTNRERFINAWHAVFPCAEVNNYYEDKGWWPWLCRGCFPNLAESPSPVQRENGVEAEKMQQTDKKHAPKEYRPRIKPPSPELDLPSQEATNNGALGKLSSSNIASQNSRESLAVLLTIRDHGDSVFLFYDDKANKFTYRLYAEPPQRIAGRPELGRWYKIWYKLNVGTVLASGQKIGVLSVQSSGVTVPIRIRVDPSGKITQFDSPHKFIKTWHYDPKYHRYTDITDGPWWPVLCETCHAPDYVPANTGMNFRPQQPAGEPLSRKCAKGTVETNANLQPLREGRFNRYAAAGSATGTTAGTSAASSSPSPKLQTEQQLAAASEAPLKNKAAKGTMVTNANLEPLGAVRKKWTKSLPHHVYTDSEESDAQSERDKTPAKSSSSNQAQQLSDDYEYEDFSSPRTPTPVKMKMNFAYENNGTAGSEFSTPMAKSNNGTAGSESSTPMAKSNNGTAGSESSTPMAKSNNGTAGSASSTPMAKSRSRSRPPPVPVSKSQNLQYQQPHNDFGDRPPRSPNSVSISSGSTSSTKTSQSTRQPQQQNSAGQSGESADENLPAAGSFGAARLRRMAHSTLAFLSGNSDGASRNEK